MSSVLQRLVAHARGRASADKTRVEPVVTPSYAPYIAGTTPGNIDVDTAFPQSPDATPPASEVLHPAAALAQLARLAQLSGLEHTVLPRMSPDLVPYNDRLHAEHTAKESEEQQAAGAREAASVAQTTHATRRSRMFEASPTTPWQRAPEIIPAPETASGAGKSVAGEGTATEPATPGVRSQGSQSPPLPDDSRTMIRPLTVALHAIPKDLRAQTPPALNATPPTQSLTNSAPSSRAPAATEPTAPEIEISIGHIEVRSAAARPAVPRQSSRPRVGLDEFLGRSSRGGRR